MVQVTSARNPLLVEMRKAVQKGTLTSDGLCIAEGFHLLEEALRSRVEIEVVVAAESKRDALPPLPTARITIVSDELLQSIASTETSQGVIALVRPPVWNFDDVLRSKALVLVLDQVQDPGNAGAMLRAAEAFGATGAVFLKGSASPYNPKALRASAGSVFRLPLIISCVQDDWTRAAQAAGIRSYAAHNGAAATLGECDFTGPTALVIGSEGHGVRDTLRDASTPVRIPTRGVESLNAAMAAGILLYEARRQRGEA